MSVRNAVSLQSSAAFQVGKKGVKGSFLAFPRNSGKIWEKNKNIVQMFSFDKESYSFVY